MEKEYTAYFRDGMLYNVSPRNNPLSIYEDRDIAYKANIIFSDGKRYDLSKEKDILAIKSPHFPATSNILELSYIMKIRCGSERDSKLISAFVRKTLELMQASKFLWRRRDYLQVIRNFYRLGLFAEGDKFEAAYRRRYPKLFSAPEDSTHENEHLSTKAYFKRKWENKAKLN